MPCNHCTFDFICIVSWLQQRSVCPLCKVSISAVQYDWRSPTDFKTFNVPSTYAAKHTSIPTALRNLSISAPYGLPEQSRRYRSYSPPLQDYALRRRREVYRKRLYSMHVGSNRLSTYQEITPQLFAISPGLQSRARAWIRRELRVFVFLQNNSRAESLAVGMTSHNAEFLLAYIVSILKKVDIKASNGHAENLLVDFLGRENARLFLHELSSWLRSPYTTVKDWDGNVQYSEDC